MRRARYLLLLPLLVLVMLRLDQVAGQSEAPPPASSPSAAEAEHIPDWMLWRLFHRLLANYANHATSDAFDMLSAHAGLSQAQSVALLAAGNEYLFRIDQIDQESRAAVAARREALGDPLTILRQQRYSAASTTDDAGVITIDVGHVLREALEQEGYVARDRQARETAYLQMHSYLSGLLDAGSIEALERMIAADIAPNVQPLERPPRRPRTLDEILTLEALAREGGTYEGD